MKGLIDPSLAFARIVGVFKAMMIWFTASPDNRISGVIATWGLKGVFMDLFLA